MIVSPPAAVSPAGRPLEADAAFRGLSFGHPLLLLGIPVLLLAVLALSLAWAGSTEAAPRSQGAPVAGLASGGGHLAPVFTPQVTRWELEIERWAAQTRLDPNLIATVIQIESCGDPNAISPSGALGLFQVMPFHFLPGEDPLDIETNARRGLGYLSRGLELSSGDVTLALAGYNGGHGWITRPAASWPAETGRYMHWGTGILTEAQSGLTTSPTLVSWLEAGGASLCRRAQATSPTR